jgi:purine-cytosine permease-like protein
MLINIIGYLRCGGRFRPRDLQAFADPTNRGVYWFHGGLNIQAVSSWLIGVVVGLLFTNSSLLTGPLADSADGVDLSFISAAAVAGVCYLLAGLVIPAAKGSAVEPVEPTLVGVGVDD